MAEGLEYAMVEKLGRKYKPFDGSIVQEMPKLLGEGRALITPKEVLTQRLIYGLSGDRQFFRSRYVHTHLGVVPHPAQERGEIKLVHKHPAIYTLNPKTKLVNHALPASEEQYEQKDGLVLSAADVQAFWNDQYALPKKREEVWEFSVEGDVKLAQDYKKDVCAESGLMFNEVMGLWLPKTKGLRLWTVDWLLYRCIAGGGGYLDYLDGRLVGVAPEAQVAREKSNLETQIQ